MLRRNRFLFILAILVFILSRSASAASEPYPFENSEQEKTYKELLAELRCLVCQNQNLADSNADLAKDLRQQTYKMLVEENATKQEVVNFMVSRYGEFILYKPPVSAHTGLLWLGPLLFLLIGLFGLYRYIQKQQDVKGSNYD